MYVRSYSSNTLFFTAEAMGQQVRKHAAGLSGGWNPVLNPNQACRSHTAPPPRRLPSPGFLSLVADALAKIGDSLETMLTSSTGHRLPFFLILVVVGLLFGAAIQQYRKLMKSNFLGGMR